ncbi:hypothetical protein [uncultured Desulfovibrio sp.]|uniref:hypothetical protein n=1 Tax=uncultured Desulfovibrio sp. TaxID=167968 RepID=UPI002634BD8B|nr:hypothetical protein [uncultured Desulfovibrio sp.]
MIDKRTDKLGLPLPHPENQLSEDVLRIQQCFALLDTAVSDNAGAAGRAQEAATTATEQAAAAQTAAAEAGLAAANAGQQIESLRSEMQDELEGIRDEMGSGLDQALSRSGLSVYAYEERGQLREIADAQKDDMAVVRGLGMFTFTPGSTEPDDDETAFAAPGGVWEMQAVSLDTANDILLRYMANESWFRTLEVQSSVSTLAAGSSATVQIDGILGVEGGERMFVVPPADISPLLTFRAYSDYWRRICLVIGNPSTASQPVPVDTPWRIILMYGGRHD